MMLNREKSSVFWRHMLQKKKNATKEDFILILAKLKSHKNYHKKIIKIFS